MKTLLHAAALLAGAPALALLSGSAAAQLSVDHQVADPYGVVAARGAGAAIANASSGLARQRIGRAAPNCSTPSRLEGSRLYRRSKRCFRISLGKW
jgi:hypothetical protein